MTLIKPNRDTFKNAYKEITGVELLDDTIDAFFRMVASIRSSQFRTFLATIQWDEGQVTINKRSFG